MTDLLDEFVADVGVAVERVAVVELIRPEVVRVLLELGMRALNLSNSDGVTFPPSLGTISRSAPNARMVSSFSCENASDDSGWKS